MVNGIGDVTIDPIKDSRLKEWSGKTHWISHSRTGKLNLLQSGLIWWIFFTVNIRKWLGKEWKYVKAWDCCSVGLSLRWVKLGVPKVSSERNERTILVALHCIYTNIYIYRPLQNHFTPCSLFATAKVVSIKANSVPRAHRIRKAINRELLRMLSQELSPGESRSLPVSIQCYCLLLLQATGGQTLICTLAATRSSWYPKIYTRVRLLYLCRGSYIYSGASTNLKHFHIRDLFVVWSTRLDRFIRFPGFSYFRWEFALE